MLAVAPGCEFEVERGPGWLLVRVENLEHDLTESLALADRLWALMEQHFTYRLVLELDHVQVLNSYLIGQLLQLHKRVGEHGGVLRLCGLSPYNRRVLHACRLDERLLPYQNREEAVMGTCRPRQPR